MANVYWEQRERRANVTPTLSADLREYLALEYPRESVGWFLRSTEDGRRAYRVGGEALGSSKTRSTRSRKTPAAGD
jgi:hypothetical protein